LRADRHARAGHLLRPDNDCPELPDRDAPAGRVRQRKIIHIDMDAFFALAGFYRGVGMKSKTSVDTRTWINKRRV
jgi:hypothetical protein